MLSTYPRSVVPLLRLSPRCSSAPMPPTTPSPIRHMRTKTPKSRLPQLSQSLGKKTTTVMKQRKLKSPSYGCVSKRNTHLYHPLRISSTFSTDAGWPHHCGRLKKPPKQLAQRNKTAVKPSQGGLKAPPRDAEGRRETIQFYVRPRTSSSVTTSLLLSMSHILSSLAFWTAEGSATRE